MLIRVVHYSDAKQRKLHMQKISYLLSQRRLALPSR